MSHVSESFQMCSTNKSTISDDCNWGPRSIPLLDLWEEEGGGADRHNETDKPSKSGGLDVRVCEGGLGGERGVTGGLMNPTKYEECNTRSTL